MIRNRPLAANPCGLGQGAGTEEEKGDLDRAYARSVAVRRTRRACPEPGIPTCAGDSTALIKLRAAVRPSEVVP